MDAVVMRGVIVAGMMMLLGLARRHLCIAQDEFETTVNRREHESRGNECPQEQRAEDDQCRPSGPFNPPRPLHSSAVPKLLARRPPGFDGIIAFFGALRTRLCAIIAACGENNCPLVCIQFVVHDELLPVRRLFCSSY
jgi:hypothetical protein